MIYDSVEAHPALVGRAKLDGADPNMLPTFQAQQLLAEKLLGLSAPALTDAGDLAFINLALATQINYQYELGVNAFVYSSLSTQPQSENKTYRADLPAVHPFAAKLVLDVLYPDGVDLADSFRTVTSVRGPQS